MKFITSLKNTVQSLFTKTATKLADDSTSPMKVTHKGILKYVSNTEESANVTHYEKTVMWVDTNNTELKAILGDHAGAVGHYIILQKWNFGNKVKPKYELMASVINTRKVDDSLEELSSSDKDYNKCIYKAHKLTEDLPDIFESAKDIKSTVSPISYIIPYEHLHNYTMGRTNKKVKHETFLKYINAYTNETYVDANNQLKHVHTVVDIHENHTEYESYLDYASTKYGFKDSAGEDPNKILINVDSQTSLYKELRAVRKSLKNTTNDSDSSTTDNTDITIH